MPLSDKDEQDIKVMAQTSLDVIDNVASVAKERLKELEQRDFSSALIKANPLTDQSFGTMAAIEQQNYENCHDLAQEPIISRVVAKTEDSERKIFYISRVTPILTGDGETEYSSYLAPIGRLAAQPAGEVIDLDIAGMLKRFEVIERTHYQPKITSNQQWDSVNNHHENPKIGVLTIPSLRNFLDEIERIVSTDDVLTQQLEEDEKASLIFEGIRRVVVDRMSLRDQPILDKYQDTIFRLPLEAKLFIIGPPGTGKTTTLIRRLGQKLNKAFLMEEEQLIINRVEENNPIPHSHSWLMFTPTELLRQYVKEAFVKEDIPASDDKIKTWDEYRRHIARNILSILRSSSASRGYILNDTVKTIKTTTVVNSIDWFQDFKTYFKSAIHAEFTQAAEWLQQQAGAGVKDIGEQALQILNRSDTNVTASVIKSLDRLSKSIFATIKSIQDETSPVIKSRLNYVVNNDTNFLGSFADFLDTLQEDPGDTAPDEEDEEDVDEAETVVTQPKRTQAFHQYFKTMRSLARAKYGKRGINPKSKTGKIVAWLGDRILEEAVLIDLGEKLTTQTKLRIIGNPVRFYTSRIPTIYRAFRKDRAAEDKWYLQDQIIPNNLMALELDTIILLMLQNANELNKSFTVRDVTDNARLAFIRKVMSEQRNQILVDEATDFSPIQLACMNELTEQRISSFFACGDFNQRITVWGTKNREQFTWAIPRIDIKPITVSYRQSQQLSELAKSIAALDSDEDYEITLPEYVDSRGMSPVLVEGIEDPDRLSDWLRDRIVEIEQLVQSLPSIAVFVDGEECVTPLAERLNNALLQNNIEVIACPQGRIIGQEGAVRVFDVQHIKGLEFEAVFFIGVDKLAEREPELFTKYLYVGTTRAATYLGIMCEAILPSAMESLRDHFGTNWK